MRLRFSWLGEKAFLGTPDGLLEGSFVEVDPVHGLLVPRHPEATPFVGITPVYVGHVLKGESPGDGFAENRSGRVPAVQHANVPYTSGNALASGVG